MQREIPMRRLGKPREVADLLFFLCSDQALYLCGSEVHIDGGQRVYQVRRPEGSIGMRAGLAARPRAKSMRYQRPGISENDQWFGPLV